MSSYLTKNKDGEYIKEIESLEVCKYRINDVCCNDKCEYLADYPPYWCKCESKEDCKFFEEEIENEFKKIN